MSVFSTSVAKDHGESSRQNCHVDQQIPFNSFLKSNGEPQPANKLLSKTTAVSNRYVLPTPQQVCFRLNICSNRYFSVNLCWNHYEQGIPLTFQTIFFCIRNFHCGLCVHAEQAAITNGKFDENGNAIVPKQATTVTPSQGKTKTKRNKGDRNTNVWVVERTERSQDNIEQLLAFIENTDTTKKTNIINVNKNNLSITERSKKEKKNTGNNKKEVRLKKSTSMEELKSSSKMEEEIAQKERAQVSLRQKQLQQQQNAQKRNSTSDSKDLPSSKQSSSQAQSNKRGERRSWGTEELADFDAIDDRDTKKHKENKLNTKNNNNNNSKKVEQVASTNASIESIPTNIEAAEFHVVTKKKKTKKRQIIEEAKAKQQQMHQRNDQGHTHGRHTNSNAAMGHKYQPSSTYTNDRDIYVNSIMAKENRRKSTSSVPPSDKSDSSDLDSVHSLPVESTTTSTSIISYAEIARKANQQQQEKLSNVNAWPPVSHNGKNSESPENSNTSTSSSTVSSKSQSSNRSYDTIKASSPSEERTHTLNMDESRTLDTPRAQPPVSDVVKSQLQKSKSCDSEKYTTTMSLDQFPGLEKTVKPQKSHPNFASVLTSPPPPLPSQPPLSSILLTTSSTNSANDKTAKGQAIKKAPTVAAAVVAADLNHPKENAVKTQKATDEKIESCKAAADVNHSKLVFVQNSAKAEEIANSDSSNLFVPITMKKTKKSQHNSNSMPANVSSKNSNGAQRTVSWIFDQIVI